MNLKIQSLSRFLQAKLTMRDEAFKRDLLNTITYYSNNKYLTIGSWEFNLHVAMATFQPTQWYININQQLPRTLLQGQH